MLAPQNANPMQRKDDNPRPPSVGGAPSGDTDRAEPRVAAIPADRKATPPPGSLADPRIGQTLVGRYRLDKLVGKGGMGRVYRGTQFPLNRPVAVKILNPEFQKKDPQFVRRFFLEAASAARLSHPNTITVFDYGEAESGELFIAMEYLRGRPLSRMISAEGPFSGERTLHVAMQICRALREAHSKGIIHRDLKPGNILLLEEGDDADFVKVLDFGLVKLFNTDGGPMPEDPLTPEPPNELTKAGMFLGSPKYMSPEQIQGVALDPRTDIYSLGVLMFQMLTCKPPFGGATSVEVIYKHVNQAVPSFKSLGVDDVPHEVEEVVHRCLAKHRDDRFESMNALLGRLKDVHRLLTGVSAATETGIEIDVSDFSTSGARPRVSIPADASTDLPVPPIASTRPQTHPARATPSAGGIEAPFSETGPLDETGSGLLMRASQVSPSPLAKAAPWFAGAAFVVVLGVLAFVLTRGDSTTPVEVPSTPNAVAESTEAPAAWPKVKVTFTSEPSGATVFDSSGLSLGRTPLTARLPRAREGAGAKSFLFKREGYAEETRQVRLEGDELEISVKLTKAGGAPNPAPAETSDPPETDPGEDEDYKENPY